MEKLKDKKVKNKVLDLTNKNKKENAKEKDKPIKKYTSVTEKKVTFRVKKDYTNLLLTVAAFTGVIVFVVGFLIYRYIFTPLDNINSSVNEMYNTTIELSEDLNNKDISTIDSKLEDLNIELNKIELQLNKYDFLQDSELTKGYYNNLLITKRIFQKIRILINTAVPDLKNALQASGFRVDENQPIPDSAEDSSAVNLIMQELPVYIGIYEKIEDDIEDILNDVATLDPNYLPSIADKDPAMYLAEFNQFAEDYPEYSSNAKNIISKAPELLGSNSKKSYLIILQNETELRASGGLLTAFGTMEIENGEISEEIDLQDMWNLEIYVSYILGIDTGKRNPYGQRYLMERGCGSSYLRAQDSGLYPDLYNTMFTLSDYYDIANNYNSKKYPDYDNVIILNHQFAQDLLNIIAPIEINGVMVDADNLFEVIKQETDDEDSQFDADRKEIIGELATIVKDKLLQLSIKDLPKVINTVVNSFHARDIAIGSKDVLIQNYLDEYNFSGRVPIEFDGDYFHFSEAQNCSLKMNKFVRDRIETVVDIKDDGSISKQMTIVWDQPEIYRPELSNYYDKTLQFRYRAWLRIFTPEGSKGFKSNAYTASGNLGYLPFSYYDKEFEKTVYDMVMQMDHRRFDEEDPIEKQRINLSYNLPEGLNYNQNGEYRLLLIKHPGKSWGEQYFFTFKYKGEEYKVDLVLDRDKIVTFKDGVIKVRNYESNLDWIPEVMNKFTNLNAI